MRTNAQTIKQVNPRELAQIIWTRLGSVTVGESRRGPVPDTVDRLLGGIVLSAKARRRVHRNLGGLICQIQHDASQRIASELYYRDRA